jgi:hypothetical protein
MLKKAMEKIQKRFGHRVDGCSIDICPTAENEYDPLQCWRELLAAAICVEQAQYIAADDRVKPIA